MKHFVRASLIKSYYLDSGSIVYEVCKITRSGNKVVCTRKRKEDAKHICDELNYTYPPKEPK